ncbi:hypothetical protein DID80_02945 [Candidatus Marinamargulisbacteria bacterium SCGC AAA071-K20]|nr:hypothetical protein DID80_02945 [Candidatus Marinamargulisbacteria bacterium SCGC AAA071-K20]
MNKKTIGYYRNKGKIEAQYSESSQFYDEDKKKTYTATFVPLELIQDTTSDEWSFSESPSSNSTDLKDLLNKKTLFISSETEKSPYYVFMYVQNDAPSMSRGGVLVKKVAEKFIPLTETIENNEYLVEIKGCGCPEGGFPNVHFRVQAGTATGYHLRITGGLSQDGAEAEIENLKLSQTGRKEHKSFIQVRPLAYKTFIIDKENSSQDMAQVIRLVPSTFRYSFSQNEAIDNLLPKSDEIYMSNLGRETALLLSSDELQVHNNINPNNLLYVSDETYVLTDYEECPPVNQYHCNLDIPNTFIPPSLWAYSENAQGAFISSFENINVRFKTLISKKRIMRLQYLNDVFLRDIIYVDTYKTRLKKAKKNESLKDNLHFIKSFMPKNYFEGDVDKWIKTRFISDLEIKKQLNEFYITFTREHGFENTKSCWNQTQTDKLLKESFEKEIKSIEKGIRQLWAASTDYSPEWINNYVSYDRLITLYYDVPDTHSELKNQYRQIKSILREAKAYFENKSFQICRGCLSFDWKKRRDAQFGHFISLVFPFAPFLLVYFYNEREMLLNVLKKQQHLSKKENEILEASIKNVREKFILLKTKPEYFYNLLIKGESEFIKAVQLPYMSGIKSAKKAVIA